jgi:hypothetical protein
LAGRTPEKPILLELDLQGYEPEAFRGAPEILTRCEYVPVETVFEAAYEGEPPFEELRDHLHGFGFRSLQTPSPSSRTTSVRFTGWTRPSKKRNTVEEEHRPRHQYAVSWIERWSGGWAPARVTAAKPDAEEADDRSEGLRGSMRTIRAVHARVAHGKTRGWEQSRGGATGGAREGRS